MGHVSLIHTPNKNQNQNQKQKQQKQKQQKQKQQKQTQQKQNKNNNKKKKQNSDSDSDSDRGNQVRNPVSLEKSLIITGPNAAGKSTYVRAILTNLILSQSLGIACASRAQVAIVCALGSFMRISDKLGSTSLFEAEVQRCAELIRVAESISSRGLKATYFLDEPMHSTPPVEGSATSRAVIEYIGKLPGVRVLVTTHYHDMASMDSKYFHNVSMDALLSHDTNTYTFPYKIQPGPSFKCIALELLKTEKHDLPQSVVNQAIRIKEHLVALNSAK